MQAGYLGINIKIQNRQGWGGRLGGLCVLHFCLEFFGAVFTCCCVLETPEYTGKGFLGRDHLNDASHFGGSFWNLMASGLKLAVDHQLCGRAL